LGRRNIQLRGDAPRYRRHDAQGWAGMNHAELRQLQIDFDERLRRDAMARQSFAHGIQLPFDGKLSDTEQRLLEQFAFEP
jgi:hypothetical protein